MGYQRYMIVGNGDQAEIDYSKWANLDDQERTELAELAEQRPVDQDWANQAEAQAEQQTENTTGQS